MSMSERIPDQLFEINCVCLKDVISSKRLTGKNCKCLLRSKEEIDRESAEVFNGKKFEKISSTSKSVENVIIRRFREK